MFNDEKDLEANRNELQTSPLGVCNIIPSLLGLCLTWQFLLLKKNKKKKG
jgi:hypothetical protein